MCTVNIRGHEANFYEAEARCHKAEIEAEVRKSEAEIQQYAHLHEYNLRRAGQQGPTRTLTAAPKNYWDLNRIGGQHQCTRLTWQSDMADMSQLNLPHGADN